jgi:hypothetical protein
VAPVGKGVRRAATDQAYNYQQQNPELHSTSPFSDTPGLLLIGRGVTLLHSSREGTT